MNKVTDTNLIPVHICKSCGARIDRKAVAPETIISGIIPCPFCGHECALNLAILGVETKLPPRRETAA
jgi:hypothetical protein